MVGLLRVWIRIKHIYKTTQKIRKKVTNIVWVPNLYSQRPARRARSQLQKPPMTCFQLFSNRPVLPARSTCAKVKKFQFKGRTIPHNQPSATRIERTTKTRGKREERYASSIVLVAGFDPSADGVGLFSAATPSVLVVRRYRQPSFEFIRDHRRCTTLLVRPMTCTSKVGRRGSAPPSALLYLVIPSVYF